MTKIKNKLWFDLTHSSHCLGGIVGIVRVELEIATALKKINPDIAFCIFENDSFREISEQELPWLNEGANIGDIYLKTKQDVPVDANKIKLHAKLDKHFSELLALHPGRVARVQQSLLLTASTLPAWAQVLSFFIIWPTNKLLSLASKIFATFIPRTTTNNPGQAQASLQVTSDKAHPFNSGDMIINAGWWDEEKQDAYQKLKSTGIGIYISYFIYDTILINKSTHHLYSEELEARFLKYFTWVSEVSDFIFYGGRTAQKDGTTYQKEHGLRIPPNAAIKLATNANREKHQISNLTLLQHLNINKNFILCVGSIEPRKNHETLYKAYLILLERNVADLPQMVFAGRPGIGTEDLIDTIKRDPRIRNKLLIVSPTDEELNALYSSCIFTLLPTYYEGWSLTLPESLSYGKFCLAADVPPLKEVAQDLVDYIQPTDIIEWADKIEYYSKNRSELLIREKRIIENWQPTTWQDCARDVLTRLAEFSQLQLTPYKPTSIWMDLTLSYSVWRGGVTGIIRSELILAHHLKRLIPNLKFYAFHGAKFFAIPEENLQWLFQSSDVATNYKEFQKKWAEIESKGKGNRIPHLYFKKEGNIKSNSPCTGIPYFANAAPSNATRQQRIKTALGLCLSLLPYNFRTKLIEIGFSLFPSIKLNYRLSNDSDSAYPALIARKIKTEADKAINQTAVQELAFMSGDIVFCAGIHWDKAPLIELIKAKAKIGFHYFPIVYDLTPLNTPHLHVPEASSWYTEFFYLTGLASDRIIYGGETALHDGQKWQSEQGWEVTPGIPIKFGSNISSMKDKSNDAEILRQLGINGQFILSVGTLENRKNHDTLYKAYLKLLDDPEINLPQLIFVGGPGWKVNNLLETISRDSRVQGKLLIMRTTDQQLDVLYRNCLFTLLASLYEGWSLTLPESLSYGKFCLTSDVPPLRETGQDLVDYIHPWDVFTWAEKIKFYSTSPEALAARELLIRQEWHPITWESCATKISKLLTDPTMNLKSEGSI